LNEVPTIILAAAVFLAVFRDRINWWYLAAGLLLFSALIFRAIQRLNRQR
ncbi:MAG: CopD family protein, partial [Saprospiraceae bacterium]|nr:CopD family protein [Saprospiraceae bacterium]